MPSLNLDLNFFDHPKTKRLVGLLGRGAEVLPMRLWAYCGKYHSADGSLTDYSPQEIEALAGWWGPAGKAVEVMVKIGFLDKGADGSLSIHDWLIHSGHIVKYHQRAIRMNKARWDDDPDDGGSTPQNKDSPKDSVTESKAESLAESQGRAGQISSIQGKAGRARVLGASLGPGPALYDLRSTGSGDRPGDVEEVVAEGELLGADAATSRRWFAQNSGRGWIDQTGMPIRGWRATFGAYAKAAKRNGKAVDPEKAERKRKEWDEHSREVKAAIRAQFAPKEAP
jgi:hypothetical protein